VTITQELSAIFVRKQMKDKRITVFIRENSLEFKIQFHKFLIIFQYFQSIDKRISRLLLLTPFEYVRAHVLVVFNHKIYKNN